MEKSSWNRVEATLEEFLVFEWLPAIRPTVRATTFANYVSHVEAQIVPTLGHLKLRQIEGRNLNAFYSEMLDSGRVDGQGGLARSSVRRIHAALHKALRDAVRWGYLNENPADASDPPKLRAEGPSEMSTWSASQVRSFLTLARSDPFHAVWFVLATTGMRRGEALGLRWCDVDLEEAHLAVRQSLVTVNGRGQLSTPKTSRSRRVVAIDQPTVSVLLAVRGRSDIAAPSEAVFAGCFEGAMNPSLVTKRFRQLVEASELPRIRLHDLRHTHATLALQAGVHPKIVSERLGHSTVSLTLDVYSHALPHMQKDAADQISRVMFGE